MAMTRATCPRCSGRNTWAHYVHTPCGPTSTTTSWDAPAELEPDGRPHPLPCPGCQTSTSPQYFKCRNTACNHQWNPAVD